MIDYHRFAAVVAEELRRDFPDRFDLCVLASRVGHDVLRYYGVEATPACVRLIAYNRRWLDLMKEVTDGKRAEFPSHEEDAEWWSVAVDEVDHGRPGRYPGHVILVVEADEILLDLSLGQASRPDRGIVFPEAAAYSLDGVDFFGGEAVTFAGDEGFVTYRYRPDAPNWRRGADWRAGGRHIPGRVIRRLRGEVLA